MCVKGFRPGQKCAEHARRAKGAPTISQARAAVCPDGSSAGQTVVVEFIGEDAEVIRRFAIDSQQSGGDLAEDVATVVALFMNGDLVTRRKRK